MKASFSLFSCIAIILVTFNAAYAQHSQPLISYSHLPSDLRFSSITTIYKDKQGFLWIGTQRGLFLYDGVGLRLFSPNTSGHQQIPDTEIRSIAEDAQGRLLVATFDANVLKWDRRKQQFNVLLDSHSMGSTFLLSMVPSRLGHLWINTDSHVGMYTINGREVGRWLNSKKQRLKGGRPTMIEEDSLGNLIVGRSNSYSIINPKEETLRTIRVNDEKLRHNYQITAIYNIDNYNLLVGTDSGDVAILEKQTGYVKKYRRLEVESILITSFLVSQDGILIGTDQGLYITDPGLTEMTNISDYGEGLSSNDVYSLYEHDTYKFVGTSHGLNILSSTPFTLINSKNSRIGAEVNTFTQDNLGRIWVGSFNGLFRQQEQTLEKANPKNLNVYVEPVSDILNDQRIMAITSTDSVIWAGFYKGGVQSIGLEANGKVSHSKSYVSHVSVIDLETGNDAQTVWVATFQHGLIRIKDGVVTEYLKKGDLKEKTVIFLTKLSSSDILVGCLDSVFLYNSKSDEMARLMFDLPRVSPFFYSTVELKSGDILFGTRNNGLFRLNGELDSNKIAHLERFNNDGDLDRSTIYGIQQDRLNNVWLSTNRGIVKLDSEGNFIRRFTMADGLQGMDFTFNSSFQSSDGRIFFGGPGGYNVFRPEEVSTHIDPPKTKLTSVRFTSDPGDKVLLTGDPATVRLTHKDKFVTFEFSIMEFVDTGNSQFRYMLENYDSEWIDNGRSHKATYTNLPTGDYRFRVQGMNAAGLWDAEGDAIDLAVLPPPWLSGWAYTLYSIAVLLLIWMGHRVYHSYVVERRASELAQEMFEAEERAEDDRQEQIEYQDELISSAYRHKLDTLNLLNTFVFEGDRNEANSVFESQSSGGRKRIHILTIMEDHIYYQPDGPAANLHSFVNAITPLLLEHSPADPDTVVTINDLPESLIPTAIASPLAIIIYELLENCIQHAFDPDSLANYIILKLEESACKGTSLSRYTLTINDDGIGAPAGILQMAEPGSGLYVVQAIVRQLEGHIELSVDQGTKVVVSLVDPE